MGYLFMLIWICIVAVMMSIKLKEDFSYAILAVINIIIIIVYCFGLMGNLIIGILGCAVLSVAYCLYCVVQTCKRKRSISCGRKTRASIFSPAFVVFIILGIWCFVSSKGMYVWSGDDLAHWALAPKEMFYSNRLAVFDETLITYKAYPPASSIWLYFAEVLNGRFSDDILFMSNQLYIFAILVSMMRNVKWEKWGKIIFIVVIILLFPLVFYYHNARYTLYSTLCVDATMGLLWGYLMSLWYKDGYSQLDIVNIGLICAVLSLMKETGVWIVALSCIAFGVDLFIGQHKCKDRGGCIIVIAAMSALAAKLSWIIYLNILRVNTSTPVSSRFSMDALITLFDEKDELRVILSGFIKRGFSAQTFGVISLSYPAVLGTLALVFIVYGWMNGKLKRILTGELVFGVIGIIWELGILYLYLFKFTESETAVYSSFERYSLTYVYAMCAFTLFFFVGYVSIRTACTVVVAVVISVSTSKYVLVNNLVNQARSNQSRFSSKTLGLQITTDIFTETDKVYVIDQDGDWASHGVFLYCMYQMCPVRMNKMFLTANNGDYRVTYQLGEKKGEEDIHSSDISLEEWENILQTYTYVYIAGYDSRFADRFGCLFEDELKNDTLYRIDKSQGISLRRVLR